jgi:hypothetical protein
MHRLTGPMAVAVGLAATAAGIGDRAAAQIAQTGELFDEFSSARLEFW